MIREPKIREEIPESISNLPSPDAGETLEISYVIGLASSSVTVILKENSQNYTLSVCDAKNVRKVGRTKLEILKTWDSKHCGISCDWYKIAAPCASKSKRWGLEKGIFSCNRFEFFLSWSSRIKSGRGSGVHISVGIFYIYCGAVCLYFTWKIFAARRCVSGTTTDVGQNFVLILGSSPRDELTTMTVRMPIFGLVCPSFTIIANVYSGVTS